MYEIDYCFGTGLGLPTTWDSAADWDLGSPGELDAVRLDFDGDGLRDDAMWDSDGDGSADTVALDLDDDAQPDHFFTDPSRTGVWNHEIATPDSETRNTELRHNETVSG